MPIRQRITKEGTHELKEYERRRLRGPRPKAPPKPSKAEREKFVNALLRLPVGETLSRKEFTARIDDMYVFAKYKVWGYELCILPLYKYLPESRYEITGASVQRTIRNEEGKQLRCKLRGEQGTWYGQVIRWIADTEYY